MTNTTRLSLYLLLLAAALKCSASPNGIPPVIDPTARNTIHGNVTFRCNIDNSLILPFWKVNGKSTVGSSEHQSDPLPEGIYPITTQEHSSSNKATLDIRIPKQPFYREKKLHLACCASRLITGRPGPVVCSDPLCTGKDVGIAHTHLRVLTTLTS